MMTPRERWLAAIRLEPVDRLPFWPKLDGAYARARLQPFRDMSTSALHEWIGSDDHMGVDWGLRERRGRTSFEVRQEGNSQLRIWRTPHGQTSSRWQFDAPSQSWHPMTFPVRGVEDIKLLTAWYDDAKVYADEAAVATGRAQAAAVGDTAVTAICFGTSALMEWVQHLAGIESAHLLLHDYPDEVAALFETMHRNLLARARLAVEASPGDLVYLNENTSTTLISLEQYRALCYPHLMEYAQLAAAAGRNMVLHMCGHLHGVLSDLATLPVRAFEAFTTPTLGNTTLLDGRVQCPDKCLIGGTNATLWTYPAGTIIATIEAELDPLPHHRGLVVTSAGVMPPMCEPETIKAVCDWVRAYPARSGTPDIPAGR